MEDLNEKIKYPYTKNNTNIKIVKLREKYTCILCDVNYCNLKNMLLSIYNIIG